MSLAKGLGLGGLTLAGHLAVKMIAMAQPITGTLSFTCYTREGSFVE